MRYMAGYGFNTPTGRLATPLKITLLYLAGVILKILRVVNFQGGSGRLEKARQGISSILLHGISQVKSYLHTGQAFLQSSVKHLLMDCFSTFFKCSDTDSHSKMICLNNHKHQHSFSQKILCNITLFSRTKCPIPASKHITICLYVYMLSLIHI